VTLHEEFALLDPESGVGLRWMRDEPVEYELLSRWMTDERLLEWVYGRDDPYPVDRVKTKFGPRVRGEDTVRPCFMLLAGRPVGYLQYYPVTEPGDYALANADATWGLDLWIGEPELWSGGIGTAVLRLVLAHLFEREGAETVVIDPRVENARAVRCYEKAGFAKVKVLMQHEMHEGAKRDSWLMEVRRGDVSPATS
jgi:aminoglycoside 6'-N-acetyltransferase